MDDYPYVWRVRSRLPERKGQRCRVLIRSRMNSCLVEFEDGERYVTSRNYLRRCHRLRSAAPPLAPSAG